MNKRGAYGQSCANCVEGKYKCVPRSDVDGCARCYRLKKPCTPSNSARRPVLQDAELWSINQKLDSLLEIIRTLQSAPPAPAPLVPSSLQSIVPPNASALQVKLESPLNTFGGRDADAALVIFRDNLVQFCPFIYLPADLTAQKLQETRPFLFEVMLAVTSRSMIERLRRGNNIKKSAALAMVVENRSNMDLLLGLLTFVAWSHDQQTNKKNTLSRLMQLASSIVYHLRLDKPEPAGSHKMTEFGGREAWRKQQGVITGSMEEKRAVMGCFLLNSVVSIYFSDTSPMSWTPQMEEFLTAIETKGEWPGDAALAWHVRVQHLVQSAEQVRNQQGRTPPIPLFLKSFTSELQRLHRSMPAELQTQNLMLAHVHYASLSIHETAFTSDYTRQARLSDPSTAGLIGPDAVDCMWQSLLAIRSWTEVYATIPTKDYVGFSLVTWAQISRVLVTLFRLSSHPAPDWDRGSVSSTLDLVQTILSMIERLGQVAPMPEEPFPDDLFARFRLQAQAIWSWIHTQSHLADATEPPGLIHMGSTNGNGGVEDAVTSMQGMPGLGTPQQYEHSFSYGSNTAWVNGSAAAPENPNGGCSFESAQTYSWLSYG